MQTQPSWWASILHGYYRLTAYHEVSDDASFIQRERLRRSRLASVVFLFAIFLVLIAVPSALSDPPTLLILFIVTGVDVLALVILNRRGYVTQAGLVLLFTTELGLVSSTLQIAGGIKLSDLTMIDLMIQGTAIAFAVLPLGLALVIPVLNCIYFALLLTIGPLAPDLASLVKVDGFHLFSQLATLQIIVAVVMALLVWSTNVALKRADKSEELAELRRIQVEQQEKDILVKNQIEEGINQILLTLGAVSSQSDFSTMRVPLAESNILWRVGRAINLMLSRLHAYRGEHELLERTQLVSQHLAECMRQGKPFELSASWTRTPFDAVIMEWNKRVMTYQKQALSPETPRPTQDHRLKH